MPRRAVASGAQQEAVAESCRLVAHALGNLTAGLSLSLELLAGCAPGDDQRRYLSRALGVCARLGAYQATLAALGGGGQSAATEIDTAALLWAACAAAHVPPGEAAVRVGRGAERLFCRAELLQEALVALLQLMSGEGDAGAGGSGQLRLTAAAEARGVTLHLAAAESRRAPWTARMAPAAAAAPGTGARLLWAATVVEHVHGGTMALSAASGRRARAVLTLPWLSKGA